MSDLTTMLRRGALVIATPDLDPARGLVAVTILSRDGNLLQLFRRDALTTRADLLAEHQREVGARMTSLGKALSRASLAINVLCALLFAAGFIPAVRDGLDRDKLLRALVYPALSAAFGLGLRALLRALLRRFLRKHLGLSS